MEEKVFTVTELNRLIKHSLERNPVFSGIWIKGEISNVTYHSSGHIYFTIKDEGALINMVFFRSANRSLDFKLEEGLSVLAFGSITVFEKRGSYQFNVTQLKKEGIGELLQRIELLRKKLFEEGIFNPEHKKRIPLLPRRLGVVTSPTGAAFRDIVKVAMRRFHNIEIVLAPSKVQGDDAAATIVKGIEELNNSKWEIDVIICGRGGGSFEDLMPFNEEDVVRAFFSSEVPIISAVGHQIDHPLSDEAADYAAPTPSAAAEIAVPLKKELSDEIDYLYLRSGNALDAMVRDIRSRIDKVVTRRTFRDPREIINMREMIVTDLENRLLSSMKDTAGAIRNRLMKIPDIRKSMHVIIQEKKAAFRILMSSIDKLSPLGVLRRGYAIVTDDCGVPVKSIRMVSPGDMVDVAIHDGSLQCTVDTIRDEVRFGEEVIIEE